MAKVAVVTGSSSGIGYETSLLLARNQIKTYATMRNMSKSDGLIKIASEENLHLNVAQLDVNDDLSVNKAIDEIVKDNDRIDILVNNAGYDLFGPLEESSLEEIKQQFETNVFGVIRTTKAVIPTMRKQGKGNNKCKFRWWKSRPTSIFNCISCKQVCHRRFHRISETRT